MREEMEAEKAAIKACKFSLVVHEQGRVTEDAHRNRLSVEDALYTRYYIIVKKLRVTRVGKRRQPRWRPLLASSNPMRRPTTG